MKIKDLPEQYRMYKLVMSNKSEYFVTGTQMKAIMESETSWVRLSDGSTINKSFGIEFKLDYERTTEYAYEHRKKILAQVDSAKAGTESNLISLSQVE